MGFSFRRSVKLGGGLRLNFSSKGMGISGGIKGARMSVGPSGTRLYGGIGPLRYQKSLNNERRRSYDYDGDQSSKISTSYTITPLEDVTEPGYPFVWLLFFIFAVISIGNFENNHHLGEAIGIFIGLSIVFNGPVYLIYRWSNRWYKSYLMSIQDTDPNAKIDHLKLAYKKASGGTAKSIGWKLAHALEEAGKYQEALQYVPDNNDSVYRFELLIHAKMFNDLIEILNPLTGTEDRNVFMLCCHYLAEAYIGKQEYDKALEWIKKGLARRGEDVVDEKRKLKILEAHIYDCMGDKKKALSKVNDLIKEAPTYEPAGEMLKMLTAKK